MKRQRNVSIDGFVTRRPQRSLLNDRANNEPQTSIGHMRTDLRENVQVHTGDSKENVNVQSGHGGDLKQYIGESLQEIDIDAKTAKTKKVKRRKRKIIFKIAAMTVGLIFFVIIALLVHKAWVAGSQMFKGDMLGIFQQQELKMDQYGRSNVLILGSTDDMPGREGASLTDSMMVLSVDQKKKDAYMFSIPRDLWVKYGRACAAGYEGKINAFFTCAASESGSDTQTIAMDETRKLVGGLFGLDIQYVAHVNTAVIRESVNAVGGITVNVDSRDERGVLDSTFDSMCADAPDLCPRGHYMDFKNGPNHMNGNQAMAFSQARGMTMPTYGLEESNFDREKNQQLVLMALKQKATSTGTLTDIGKVMGLMESLGNNLRTNVDAKEVQTIMRLGSEISDESVHRISFYEEDNRLLTTGSMSNQSIVRPVAGVYDFSDIQSFLKRTINATDVSREAAKVAVLNGGGATGAAQKQADKLEDLGMKVVLVDNAPEGDYGSYKVLQANPSNASSKQASRSKLQEIYSTTVAPGPLPFELAVEVDFVVIIGPDSATSDIIE